MKLRTLIVIIAGLASGAFSEESPSHSEEMNQTDSSKTSNAPISAVSEVCDTTKYKDKWFYTFSECDPQPTQISLMVNIAKENVKGSQIALMTNFANKDLDGFQLTFGYNHAGGRIDGAQISTFVNYADRVDGAQVSTSLNVAKTVAGWQVGRLNIADSVKGVQLGFINIARHLEGSAVGMFSYSKNGLFHLDYTAEGSGMNKLTFATGKTFYTAYSAGYTFEGKTNPYSFGMGFGYHRDMGRMYLEGEFDGSVIFDKKSKLSRLDRKGEDVRHNSLLQLKARLGRTVFSNFGIFGGITLNMLETNGHGRLMAPWTDRLTKTGDDLYFWPGVEIGVRFGR